MIPPQGLVAVTMLGMVGLLILFSKWFTKAWIWLLLLSPSWGATGYNMINALLNGESPGNILSNHAISLLFILHPIDDYLISSAELFLFGAVLLGIWLYVIAVTCTSLLGGWALPLAPPIFWLLGKGLPNTFKILAEAGVPAWLTSHSGLPLILLASITLALLVFFTKRRK